MVLRKIYVQFLSEFLATCFLIVAMCLSCAAHNEIVFLSFAYGFIHLILLQTFGVITGAHANPAVTFALAIISKRVLRRLPVYVLGQVTGAIFGHYVANTLLGRSANDTLCTIEPSPGLPFGMIMVVEFVLTLILILPHFALSELETKNILLLRPLLNTLVILVGGNVTGCSTNPARSLAPAAFGRNDEKLLAYLFGQVMASIAAPYLWRCIKHWYTHQPCKRF